MFKDCLDYWIVLKITSRYVRVSKSSIDNYTNVFKHISVTKAPLGYSFAGRWVCCITSQSPFPIPYAHGMLSLALNVTIHEADDKMLLEAAVSPKQKLLYEQRIIN